MSKISPRGAPQKLPIIICEDNSQMFHYIYSFYKLPINETGKHTGTNYSEYLLCFIFNKITSINPDAQARSNFYNNCNYLAIHTSRPTRLIRAMAI